MFTKVYLHNNSLIASVQLLAWLLFHPSAWRDYISQIHPSLQPNFVLSDVPINYKHDPKLRRLRYLAYIVLPLLVGVLIGLLLSMIHLIPWFFAQLLSEPDSLKTISDNELVKVVYQLPENFVSNLVLGVSYGMVLCLISSVFSTLIISFPFALMASVLGGFSVGLFLGSGLSEQNAWAIILGIFTLSIAGSVITHWHQESHHRTFSWQMGSFVIGTGLGIVSAIVVGIIMLAITLLIGASVGWIIASFFPEMEEDFESYAQIIGMAVTIGLFLGGYLKKNWRDALKWGLLFGSLITLLMALILGIVSQMEEHTLIKRLLSGITGGTVNAAAFSILFAVPYLLAQRFASIRAGVIAGIFGSGGLYLGVMLMAEGSIYWVLWGLLFFVLGFSQKSWLPILSYPIESAWNLWLYRAQKRHPERSVELLSQHSAFWNEHQRLPLRGLESLLVSVHKHNQSAAQDAMMQLSNGLQSWAVQATQIEANMQRLEACQTIENIAEVHEELIVSDQLESDVGKWLQGLFQISQKLNQALKQNSYQQQIAFKEMLIGLETILKFATQKSTEAQRFGVIAKTWLNLVKTYLKKLEEVQEIPNPYIVGIPLKEGQDVFIPRPKVNKRIERLLLDRSSPPLLLYGQRRTGKTSLLNNLVKRLPDNFIMLFVDFQGPLSSAQNHLSFFYNLGRAMSKSAQKQYPDLTLPPLSEDTLRSDPATRFDEWLDEIEEAIGDKILLLALDEFITLDHAFHEGRLQVATLLGLFRNIIQHRPKFRFLFSGAHTFEELQHWANYMINVQIAHLNYLSEAEAHQLIEQPIKHFPLRYTPEALQRVKTLTRCQPALLQSLCGEIVPIKDEQAVYKRLTVDVADVDAAIPLVLEHSKLLFAEIREEQIDQNGEAILRFIASHGEGAIISREKLAAQLPTEFEPTLALLLRRELIEPVDNDGYRFQVELVRRWF
ncbi:MAG: ATP-binding protein [Candidatus Parabeggiatoa sp. nov. 3]|nr:MAG: ATP-binding protein [Gammaproteobacteria bacterium]RKZ61753.1 MAG: ATP-binding protein [Gammaproteobacteria bacterium]RKZ88856.1 MAG: ATP-binding protein [Gammaproteobacteria bacterium]